MAKVRIIAKNNHKKRVKNSRIYPYFFNCPTIVQPKRLKWRNWGYGRLDFRSNLGL